MIIRKSWRREWARLLWKMSLFLSIAVMAIAIFETKRIVGDELSPTYKDGDLVFYLRLEHTPILLLRVRGFDD